MTERNTAAVRSNGIYWQFYLYIEERRVGERSGVLQVNAYKEGGPSGRIDKGRQ